MSIFTDSGLVGVVLDVRPVSRSDRKLSQSSSSSESGVSDTTSDFEEVLLDETLWPVSNRVTVRIAVTGRTITSNTTVSGKLSSRWLIVCVVGIWEVLGADGFSRSLGDSDKPIRCVCVEDPFVDDAKVDDGSAVEVSGGNSELVELGKMPVEAMCRIIISHRRPPR